MSEFLYRWIGGTEPPACQMDLMHIRPRYAIASVPRQSGGRTVPVLVCQDCLETMARRHTKGEADAAARSSQAQDA